MGFIVAGIFGYLLLLFLFLLVVNYIWDRFLRRWFFLDKINEVVESAKEEYTKEQVNVTLEETFKSRRPSAEKKK